MERGRKSSPDRRSSPRSSSGRPTPAGRSSDSRKPSDRRSAGSPSARSGRPDGKSRPSDGRKPADRPAPSRYDRPPLDRPRRARIHEPNIPPEITGEELDRSIKRELSTLSVENGKVVAAHLVAAGLNLDSDPKLALQHARAAVYHAGRIAVVRESLGIAAYACGEFAEALREFRAALRISGDPSNWPMMADCERGLGRPAKALAMAGAPEAGRLDLAGQIELRIVAAGARRDMGQVDAALVTLTCPELKIKNAEWSGRLRYAYADTLLASGRKADALAWFERAAAADPQQLTDALERIEELQGISVEFADLEEDEETDS